MLGSEQISHKRLALIYFATLIPLAIDYRSEGAGEGAAIQGPIFALHVLLVCYLIASYGRYFINIPSVNILIILCIVFQLDGTIVSLLNNDDVYIVITRNIPVALYWSSAFITAHVLVLARDDAHFTRTLKLLCFIFLISGFLIDGIIGGGIDLSRSRYEILGASIIPSLGLITVAIAIGMTAADFLLILTALIAILISVTRTFLISAVVQLAALAPASLSILGRPNFWIRATVGAVTLVAVVGVDNIAETGLTDRWIERLFVGDKFGVDPTYLTRVAEVEFMQQEFLASTPQTLFGNGIGTTTSLIGDSVSVIASLIGRESATIHSTGFGHHNHWSLLYVGGVLTGGPLLVFQFINVWWAITFLSIERLRRARENDTEYLGLWGATIVLGTVAYGFLAGTFILRGFSLWYGIGTGLLLAARASQQPVSLPARMPQRLGRRVL